MGSGLSDGQEGAAEYKARACQNRLLEMPRRGRMPCKGHARTCDTAAHLDEAPVAVAGVAGGDALADDARACVLADVQHLGAGVGLRTAQKPCQHTLQTAGCGTTMTATTRS